MANRIWIVLEQRESKLHRMSWEAIAAGQALAAELGGQAEAVLLGSGVDALAAEVAACRVTAVHLADLEPLADYSPGAYVGVLAAAIGEAKPDVVLFPHTYQSVDYVPRLSQEVGGAMVSEAIAFANSDDGPVWTRPIFAGKLEAKVRARQGKIVLASLQSGAFAADAVEKAESPAPIERLAVDADVAARDREILGVEAAGGGQEVDLSQSEMVVGVGRGIGGAENLGIIEELAAALGAEVGASRPVIDSGWLPRDRQIGSSGQTVAPKLYLAVGISGAIQHLVGMKGSRVVAAINKDPGAPIFNVAQYGIVGDLHEVVPALTAAIREAKG